MEDDYSKSNLPAMVSHGLTVIDEQRITYADGKGGMVVDLCVVARKG
jgi:hypothetical protein